MNDANFSPDNMIAFSIDTQSNKIPLPISKIIPTIEEILPFGIWICDANGRLIYVSQSYLDMIQMSYDEAREFGWSKNLPTDNIEPTLSKWKDCVENKSFWDEEHIHIGKDQLYHILSRGAKIEVNNETYWLGINLDITEKKRVYLEHQKLSQDYEFLMNRIEDSFASFDNNFNLKYINRAGLSNLQTDKILIGKNFFEEFPILKGTVIEENFYKAFNEQVEVNFTYFSPLSEKWFNTKLYPSPDGLTFFASEVTEEIKAKNKLQKSLKEKEVLLQEKELLLKEVYHRDKNNFQLLLSLVNLQSNGYDDPLIKSAFSDIWNRINSIGLLYELLHMKNSFTDINIQDYVNNLVEALNRGFARGNNIIIETSVDEVFVSHSFAISLGLIINELVSNSIKHAFPLNSQGKIKIVVELSEDNMLKITVEDNGRSSKEFKTDGLGLLVVKSLTEQYSGNFNLHQNNGTIAVVSMKLN